MSMLLETKWENGHGLEELNLWGVKPMRLFLEDFAAFFQNFDCERSENGLQLKTVFLNFQNHLERMESIPSADDLDDDEKLTGLQNHMKTMAHDLNAVWSVAEDLNGAETDMGSRLFKIYCFYDLHLGVINQLVEQFRAELSADQLSDGLPRDSFNN